MAPQRPRRSWPGGASRMRSMTLAESASQRARGSPAPAGATSGRSKVWPRRMTRRPLDVPASASASHEAKLENAASAVSSGSLSAVAVGPQPERQEAVDTGDVALAGGQQRAHRPQAAAAGADHELADARGCRPAAVVLRREALVVVVVAGEHDVGASGLPGLPERVGALVAAVQDAGAEARVVPVGEDAGRRMGGQVAA